MFVGRAQTTIGWVDEWLRIEVSNAVQGGKKQSHKNSRANIYVVVLDPAGALAIDRSSSKASKR